MPADRIDWSEASADTKQMRWLSNGQCVQIALTSSMLHSPSFLCSRSWREADLGGSESLLRVSLQTVWPFSAKSEFRAHHVLTCGRYGLQFHAKLVRQPTAFLLHTSKSQGCGLVVCGIASVRALRRRHFFKRTRLITLTYREQQRQGTSRDHVGSAAGRPPWCRGRRSRREQQ